MNKVSYANLKLKVNTDVNTFDFNGQKIEVLKYLPLEDKYDLIRITLQKAKEANNLYDPIKLDAFFHLHMVYMYTNLSFTDKQKENEIKIFDTLKSNGFIDLMLQTIDEAEYNYLFEVISSLVKTLNDHNNSVAGLLSSVLDLWPENAQKAADIVNTFDPQKYQAVVDFATAANGNRPIAGANANLSIHDVDDGK